MSFCLFPRGVREAMVAGMFAAWFAVNPADGVEAKICPVHHVGMQAVDLRMVYGMPSSLEFKEMRVARELFPHGRDYVLGGCVVRPEKSVAGQLCPRCIEARKAWLASEKGGSKPAPSRIR